MEGENGRKGRIKRTEKRRRVKRSKEKRREEKGREKKRREYTENMANEAERRVEARLVPRVARGCQPQDNNFIIGGITPARRGTVPVCGVGGSIDIVSIRTGGMVISSPAVSPLGRSRG